MWTIFKDVDQSLLNMLQYRFFLFNVLGFGHKACEIISP